MPTRGETETLLGGMSAGALCYNGTIDVKIIFHNPKFSFEFLGSLAQKGRLQSFHSSKASFV